jgi:hypothetical protein
MWARLSAHRQPHTASGATDAQGRRERQRKTTAATSSDRHGTTAQHRLLPPVPTFHGDLVLAISKNRVQTVQPAPHAHR